MLLGGVFPPIRDLADSTDDENLPAAPAQGPGRHTLRGPGGQFTAARATRVPNTPAEASSPKALATTSPRAPIQSPAAPTNTVAPVQLQPSRVQLPYIDDDEMPEEKMFHGDGRPGESPHDFKKKVMARFVGKTMTEAEKVDALGYGLASGSTADTWFDEPARAGDKASWATLSAAFDVKWPKRTALRRIGQDAIEDLLAEKLKVEDIGKRVTHGGVEEFGHVVWVRKLARIAADIPDPSGLFIGVVREKMPMIMQDLLGPATVFADWNAFEAAVVDIKKATIVHAQTKEARLVEMAAAAKPVSRNVVTSHLASPPHHLARPQPYVYPPYQRPQGPPPNVYPVPQQQAPAAPRAPPTYRPDSERLVDLERNLPVHHPNTDVGRAAWAQDTSDWHARNGNRGPNELRPFPLTPGTAPLDAQGECFKCALFGHMTAECPNPELPPLEKKWRQIAASIRRGANATRPRNPPAPTPVQYVAAPYHFDPNAAYPYHPWAAYAPYAAQYDAQDQGNGEGPSN
ncbi:hypothetical protein C8R43DRAFT_1124888 [Mycena crocata]|nr:hypothetical protein C8R43DRAFT_1124888 [Mycena crocata]